MAAGHVTASLALDCRAGLGESPVALSDGRLLLVDITGKRVLAWDSVAGRALEPVPTDQMVGCIVPAASGGLLAGLEDSIAHIPTPGDGSTGSGIQAASILAPLPEHLRGPKKRCNDGKCDPQGRFWVGTMHSSWRDEAAPRGALLCTQRAEQVEGEGQAWALEEKVPDTRLANGLAWSADSSLMFFIDSALRTVDCFDYDAGAGGISNRRTVVTFSEKEPGVPDGMAIDAGGKLWVVVGESGSVRQVDPETGVEVARVTLPVQRPTSCAFGGKDLSELYITTREETGPSAHLHAGGLFKAQIPGVKGPSFSVSFQD